MFHEITKIIEEFLTSRIAFTKRMSLNKLHILSLFFVVFITLGCEAPQEKNQVEFSRRYLCDAEIFDEVSWSFMEATGQSVHFQNVDTRSREIAWSGEFSAELTPLRPYGFTVIIDSVMPDDYLQISAMILTENSTGFLVVDGGEELYFTSKEIVKSDDSGWEKIQLECFIPPNFIKDSIKVYAWLSGPGRMFVDDFEVNHRRTREFPLFDSINGLQLFADEQSIRLLSDRRLSAFSTGVLENHDEDFSPVILFDGDNFMDARFRLKGDLVDHIQGSKWSFRIKLRDGFSWQNMLTFSIHTPIARDFLNEWVAHKIFEDEDILTTRYGFVPVMLNGKSLGIYAWEEHFEKQLIESRNRREGPIIRFDETYFWRRVIEANLTGKSWDVNYFASSKIAPFKSGSILADSLKWNQMVDGANLLEQFRTSSMPVDRIFDLDKLARYYALVDITRARHGFVWHNMRFYFNPITCLLEPIAFDGYIEGGVYQRFESPVIGLTDPLEIIGSEPQELMLFQVFSNELFNKKYLGYLMQYSDEKFVNQIISSLMPEIDSLSALIRQEFPSYHYDNSFLGTNARFIREHISQISENVSKLGFTFSGHLKNQDEKSFTKEVNDALITGLVHAYVKPDERIIQIENFHSDTIHINGYKQELSPLSLFDDPVILEGSGGKGVKREISLPADMPDSIQFEVGSKSYLIAINPWPRPEGLSSRQISENSSLMPDWQVNGDTILIEGVFSLDKDVFIPSGYKVIFASGSELDLTSGCGFFSSSPIYMNGNAEMPVKVYSSDRTSNGFNVFQAEERSVIQNTIFEGLGNIRRGGWQTPSAITFYESDVDFISCTFTGNHLCDDALNIVRSDFLVDGCLFENTFADAFDSDYCTGIVRDSRFNITGNDAIDFSGSRVLIEKCTMSDISDKAISGGENSFLDVRECTVQGAIIGIASKDLSLVKVDEIEINKAVYGLVSFIKKPEYGPARIIVENLRLRDTHIYHKLEIGSDLTVNGRLIKGTEKNLALRLYQ